MIGSLRKILILVVPILALTYAQVAVSAGREAVWTIVFHPADFVIGPALKQLHTRHGWVAEFDARRRSRFRRRNAEWII
jgi:hypothetical protein